MSDYIKRSDALDRFTYEHGDLIPEVLKHGEPNEIAVRDIKAALRSVPASDVAPVVRCRECRHYKEHRTKKYGNLVCKCTRMGKYDMDYPVKPDDFCSYGEKSTDKSTEK